MKDYKKMYYELFNEVTNTIENLKRAQQKAEETFVSSYDEDIPDFSSNKAHELFRIIETTTLSCYSLDGFGN